MYTTICVSILDAFQLANVLSQIEHFQKNPRGNEGKCIVTWISCSLEV